MSQYKCQFKEVAEKQQKNMFHPSVPPKYDALLKEYQENLATNAVITLSMTILNLKTKEDYESIAVVLRSIEGVKDIGAFQEKKISVSYNQHQTSLEDIVYQISRLGYRYINRF
ncbi:hypothetical protein SAMN05660297_00410 [Natronincola peptidivorans]|uniref:HMA domain-containing protein n=1 Tax=Natronincola peptidivorans TaxID=426128 RepID=A0A1H9YU95_9FIRM|nr:heavy-metal-associated domain-containing protein [Natronincola peptidivorans]SES72738.1 hypothetical protein SAMN05660297_00410 [Natronincola peptidivorans]